MTPEEILKLWHQGNPKSQTVYFDAIRTIVFWDNGKTYAIASAATSDDKFPPAGPFASFEHLELAMAMRGFSLSSPLRERSPMNELAQQLHEAAITLENDAAFHNAYTTLKDCSYFDARALIRRYGLQLGLDVHVKVVESREQLRRHLDETYNLSETRYCGTNSLAGLPTIEFWKDSVREGREVAKATDSKPTFVKDHTTKAQQHFDKVDAALTKKEPIMNKTAIIEITTKTLVNGTDVKDLDDSAIYDLIAQQEAEIKRLEAIENKPKKLVAEIEKRRAGIKALVDYLDSKAD